jgi:hypothetical protein
VNTSESEVTIVWRYDDNGAPDLDFHGEGLVQISNSGGGDFDTARGVAVDSQDRIVVAGTTLSPQSLNLAIWRVLP